MQILNAVVRYFDLQSAQRNVIAGGHKAKISHAPVFPQYIVVSAGVILEPFLRHYINNGSWSIDISMLWGRVFFGLVVGILILPSIYKSSFDPKKPTIVQLAALFPLGIGWQSLFASATKAIAG